jgi:hypothetical protein
MNTKKEDILDYVELPTDAKALGVPDQPFHATDADEKREGERGGPGGERAALERYPGRGGTDHVSGEELFARMLAHLFPGVKAALMAVVDVIYANLNRVEVFNYFNGEADEI